MRRLCGLTKTQREEKNGSEFIGHSRGGPTTKIHAVVDGLRNPTKIELTEGQVHDVTQAPTMLNEALSTTVIADKGYDSNAVVEQIEAHGSRAVIPPRRHALREARSHFPGDGLARLHSALDRVDGMRVVGGVL